MVLSRNTVLSSVASHSLILYESEEPANLGKVAGGHQINTSHDRLLE